MNDLEKPTQALAARPTVPLALWAANHADSVYSRGRYQPEFVEQTFDALSQAGYHDIAFHLRYHVAAYTARAADHNLICVRGTDMELDSVNAIWASIQDWYQNAKVIGAHRSDYEGYPVSLQRGFNYGGELLLDDLGADRWQGSTLPLVGIGHSAGAAVLGALSLRYPINHLITFGMPRYARRQHLFRIPFRRPDWVARRNEVMTHWRIIDIADPITAIPNYWLWAHDSDAYLITQSGLQPIGEWTTVRRRAARVLTRNSTGDWRRRLEAHGMQNYIAKLSAANQRGRAHAY